MLVETTKNTPSIIIKKRSEVYGCTLGIYVTFSLFKASLLLVCMYAYTFACIFLSPYSLLPLPFCSPRQINHLNIYVRTPLVAQWLRLRALNAGGLGSIPGQGTRSHMLQLKILHAATKTQHSQMNK